MKIAFFLLTLNIISVFTSEVNNFIQSNNQFTSSIYKEIIKCEEDNFLASPFSAEAVLALAQSGAKGETLKELRSGLHLSENQEKIETDVKTLLSSLQASENYKLHVANKIYIKKDHPFKKDFEKIAVEVFRAGLENIDFAQKNEAANKINKWVEEQTADKIHNLINPGSLDEFTRAILINALYFQGNWSQPFSPFRTKFRKFYKNGNSFIRVHTMVKFPGNYRYSENVELHAKFLELPFKDESASMIFILPNEREGLPTLEKQIDKVFLPQEYITEEVNVALPKFKIESRLDFKAILKNLGVRKPFSEGIADFSGICDEEIFIDEIIQKTFIAVGESGVEAAAATEVEFSSRSGHSLPPPQFKNFIADHPFLFYIKVKDVIIFVGKVTSPKLE